LTRLPNFSRLGSLRSGHLPFKCIDQFSAFKSPNFNACRVNSNTNKTTQRKIKAVSGCLVLKLVTWAYFRIAIFCLSCAYFLTDFGLEGCKMLISMLPVISSL